MKVRTTTRNLINIAALIVLIISAITIINVTTKADSTTITKIEAVTVSRDGYVMTIVDENKNMYQWHRHRLEHKEFEATYSVLLVAKRTNSYVMINYKEHDDVHTLKSVSLVN